MPAIKSYVWCFTLNNPSEERINFDPLVVSYAVYQLEKGEEGTPHFQGYVEMVKQSTLGTMRRMFQAHWTVARRPDKAVAYCMKEDSRLDGPWEFGTRSVAGKRKDVYAIKDAIDAGMTKGELHDAFPDALDRFPRMVAAGLERQKRKRTDLIMEYVPRLTWQKNILDLISNDPDPRKIVWVYDPMGNHGKTFLSMHLVDKYGAFYSNGGKATDISYGYDGQNIVVFDFVRDSKEYVGYGIIEQLKNGILFSPKYESGVKRNNVPHVIVMANFRPEMEKLSFDRWQIIELNSVGQIL